MNKTNEEIIKVNMGKLIYLFGNKYIKTFNLKRLKLDKESIYSVTPFEYTLKIVDIITKNMNSNDITITDACACVGADTISLSKNFKKVNAIELNDIRFNFLKDNLKLANVNNCNIKKGDCLKILNNIEQDVIFIDAPWEGKDYKLKKEMNLYLSGKPLTEIVNDLGDKAKMIVLKVPNNFVFEELKKNANFKFYKKYDLNKFQIIILKDFLNIKKNDIKKNNDIKNLEESIVKLTIKDIKKTEEYKKLPNNLNKSKLNKKDLCKLLNKYN